MEIFLLLFSFVEIFGIAQNSRKVNQIQGLGLLRPKTGAKWAWGNSKSVYNITLVALAVTVEFHPELLKKG
jgi:hypothetical protein